MSRLKDTLKVGNNVLTSYFPARTSVPKEGDFDWQIAAAVVIRNLYRKRLSATPSKSSNSAESSKERLAIARFQEQCKTDFLARLDEPEVWKYIDEMYFKGDDIYQIVPEAMLFKLADLNANSAQHRLANMFTSLMHGFYLKETKSETSNFVESQVRESLLSDSILEDIKDGSQNMSKGINEKPYLPYLSKVFKEDLNFLGKRPKYLIEQIENLLRLYAYLYTAQLALNIKSIYEEPTVRPLYFILENETASKERTNLVAHGHQSVQRFLPFIFPYLSMSESLQSVGEGQRRIPLWELAQALKDADAEALKNYALEFARDRSETNEFVIEYDTSQTSSRYWLEQVLLKEAFDQFGKKKKRAAAQEKFIRTTESELCSIFAKPRGQAGKVLILNQDYISLFTNLCIGESERLRFSELITKFRTRGICFDKQSQQALIKFYERVGNVERMSDSGDAIYVRKTI
ncbi:MAG: DNA phosphorothioation-dependent restriction protein DptG [Reinekea sp.]